MHLAGASLSHAVSAVLSLNGPFQLSPVALAIPTCNAVLPCGTPSGSPQLPVLLGAGDASGAKGGKAAEGEQPARRPLSDVTHHFAAASKGICIGALGGSFGMDMGGPLVASCSQEAQAAAAAAANKARVAAARRQALRAMR